MKTKTIFTTLCVLAWALIAFAIPINVPSTIATPQSDQHETFDLAPRKKDETVCDVKFRVDHSACASEDFL